jgi:hypothetical protein
MDIQRTADVIGRILRDFEQNQIPSLVSNAATALKNWAANTNEQTGEAYVEAMSALENALKSTTSQDLQPISFRILKDLGGENFVGNAPYWTIRNLLEEAGNPASARQNVMRYRSDFDLFVNRIQTLQGSLTELGVIADEGDLAAEVGVIIPCKLAAPDVKGSQKAIAGWGLCLSNLAETVGESRDSVSLVEVERGSLIVIFGTSIAVAKVLFWITNNCLDIYSKYLDIRLKRKELHALGVSEQSTQAIEDETQSKIDADIDDLVRTTIQKCSPGEARTGEEIEKLVRVSVRHVLDQIDNGTEVEVDIPVLENQPDDDGGPPVSEVEIRTFANRWHRLHGSEKNILQLQGGEPDSTDPEVEQG